MSETPAGVPEAPRSPGAFEEVYQGKAPWDIGRAQPAFEELLEAGRIAGRVLDVGCGTGEHALMAAAHGLEATGVDSAPTALEQARHKAAERGLAARFVEADACDLASLGEDFDTVIDSGLFHVFDDADRARYVASLAAVVRPGGRYLMCCFSDRQPGDWGPRRVTEQEIRDAFARGWSLESLDRTIFATNLDPPEVQAWRAVLVRS